MVDLGKNIFLTPLIKAQFTRTILLIRSSIKLIKTGKKKRKNIEHSSRISKHCHRLINPNENLEKKIRGGKQELLIERNKSFRHPQKERKSNSLSLSPRESLEPENIATLRADKSIINSTAALLLKRACISHARIAKGTVLLTWANSFPSFHATRRDPHLPWRIKENLRLLRGEDK